MKRTERIFGILAISLFTIAVLFKFMHWPGSSVMHGISALQWQGQNEQIDDMVVVGTKI
jgi:hypothetical protein